MADLDNETGCPPHYRGQHVVVYHRLRRALVEKGHGRAAAEWAIHRHTEAGRLTAERRTSDAPAVIKPDGRIVTFGKMLLTDRAECLIRSAPALATWWHRAQAAREAALVRRTAAGRPGGGDSGAGGARVLNPVLSQGTNPAPEAPSPFTVPEPEFVFVEQSSDAGSAPARPEPTLGEHWKELREFARDYLRATEAARGVSYYEQRYILAGRDANADAARKALERLPSFDQFRTLVRVMFGLEVGPGALNLVVNALVGRDPGLTVTGAERLKLSEAIRRLGVPTDRSERTDGDTPALPPPVVPTGPAPAPFVPLMSWCDILAALNEGHAEPIWKNNARTREQIRALNAQHGGPITFPQGRGKQPRVEKAALLAWWEGLRSHFDSRAAEAEREDESTRLTASGGYDHGRDGHVAPGLNGHVKKRRRRR